MAPKKTSRTGARAFPKAAFFSLRLLQVFAAIVCLGILGYFHYALLKDGYKIPYEFVILDISSVVTIVNALVTSVLICCSGLSALYVLIVDALLTLFWIVSWAMLLKAMGKTTTQTCAVATWGNNQGVRVCMMFKVLVTFSFVALLAFVGMVIVAVVARKKQSGHTYEPALNPANMRANTSYNPLRSNVHSAFYSAPEPAYGVDERNKVGGKPEKQEGEAGEATSYYG